MSERFCVDLIHLPFIYRNQFPSRYIISCLLEEMEGKVGVNITLSYDEADGSTRRAACGRAAKVYE